MALRVKLPKTNKAILFINAPRLPKVQHIWRNESRFLPCVPLKCCLKHQDRYRAWDVEAHTILSTTDVRWMGPGWKKASRSNRPESDRLICEMARLKLNCKQYPSSNSYITEKTVSLSPLSRAHWGLLSQIGGCWAKRGVASLRTDQVEEYLDPWVKKFRRMLGAKFNCTLREEVTGVQKGAYGNASLYVFFTK